MCGSPAINSRIQSLSSRAVWLADGAMMHAVNKFESLLSIVLYLSPVDDVPDELMAALIAVAERSLERKETNLLCICISWV